MDKAIRAEMYLVQSFPIKLKVQTSADLINLWRLERRDNAYLIIVCLESNSINKFTLIFLFSPASEQQQRVLYKKDFTFYFQVFTIQLSWFNFIYVLHFKQELDCQRISKCVRSFICFFEEPTAQDWCSSLRLRNHVDMLSKIIETLPKPT